MLHKKKRDVDESNTDPFTFPLYEQVANWFINEENIFQWNCMARFISIEHLGFSNLKRGSDSIIIKFNKSKIDITGEKCSN